jgi:hypothetical protein
MNRMKIIKMRPGAKLPMAKKGMYILLQGSIRAKAHWKKEAGYSTHQQQYQNLVYKQLGRTDLKYDFVHDNHVECD